MPILDPSLISNWYFCTDPLSGGGSPYVFESWKANQDRAIAEKPLIQGDIGVHVMDVGGFKYSTDIKSPILVLAVGSANISSIYQLLSEELNVIRDSSLLAAREYDPNARLLKSATINYAPEGVSISMSFYSEAPSAFALGYIYSGDIIARVARWYDMTFHAQPTINRASIPFTANDGYFIKSGEITFTTVISENYFMNDARQTPFFGVQGYAAQGSLVVIAPPTNPAIGIQPQTPGQFDFQGYASISLGLSGSVNLPLGSGSMFGTIARSLAPGQPTTLTTSFKNYANASAIL